MWEKDGNKGDVSQVIRVEMRLVTWMVARHTHITAAQFHDSNGPSY
jgi:hypothetical protein